MIPTTVKSWSEDAMTRGTSSSVGAGRGGRPDTTMMAGGGADNSKKKGGWFAFNFVKTAKRTTRFQRPYTTTTTGSRNTTDRSPSGPVYYDGT